jgi:predicted transcriptional regulator
MTTALLERPAQTQVSARANVGTVSVKLDADYRDRLRRLAQNQKRTPHYLMKEAIQGYVEQAEVRQNFINAAEASWLEYEKTGLHNTQDELKSWLSSWGTPSAAPMPACHT